jgi:hypothetical protein
MFRSSDDHHQGAFWSWLKSLVKMWVFKCGYVAAYVHSFCMLYCVERLVDMSGGWGWTAAMRCYILQGSFNFVHSYVKIDERWCPDYLASGITTFDVESPAHVGLCQSATYGCTGQVIRSNGWIHAKPRQESRLSHGFIAPRPLYTGPLCPTLE